MRGFGAVGSCGFRRLVQDNREHVSFMSALILAYIDPGAGSMLLQLVAAGLFSFLFALKLGWSHIKNVLRTLTTRRSPPSNAEE
jgi:hypothetical protein